MTDCKNEIKLEKTDSVNFRLMFEDVKLNRKNFALFSDSQLAKKVWIALHNFQSWTNNAIAGDGHLSTDFESDKYKLLLDGIEIDSSDVDSHGRGNGIQKKISKETTERVEKIKENPKKYQDKLVDNKIINNQMTYIDTRLSSDVYKSYITNLKVRVGKHIQKIDSKYKINHSEYKVGFMLNDVSPIFMELLGVKNERRNRITLQKGSTSFTAYKDSRLVRPFLDKDIYNMLVQSNLDFLIWNFKTQDNPKAREFSKNDTLPHYLIIDISELRKYSPIPYYVPNIVPKDCGIGNRRYRRQSKKN